MFIKATYLLYASTVCKPFACFIMMSWVEPKKVYIVIVIVKCVCVCVCVVSRVEASCKPCGGICTLRHILTGCPTALRLGRYTWRHNSVLSVLCLAITNAYHQRKAVDPSLPYVTYVKPGEPAKPSGHPPRKPLSDSLLAGASDWIFLFDLHEGLVFPPILP